MSEIDLEHNNTSKEDTPLINGSTTTKNNPPSSSDSTPDRMTDLYMDSLPFLMPILILVGCILLLGLIVGVYGLSIVDRNKANTNPICKTELRWIRVYCWLIVTCLALGIIAAPLGTENPVAVCFGSLGGFLGIFQLGWAAYGIKIFFNVPICPITEIHSFGLVMTWIFIVVSAISCCCCCLGSLFVMAAGNGR